MWASAEWRLAREHLVEDDAERVYVGALVERLARGLFGRDVARRAVCDLRRVGRLRADEFDDAEVGYLDAVAASDHYVRRLQVAVDYAAARRAVLVAVDEGVRVGDGVENLLEEVEGALGLDPFGMFGDELRERAALDVLHDDEVGLLGDDVVVDFDDAGVVELRLHVCLALEAVAESPEVVRAARADCLDGDDARELLMSPAV